jgi:hypothetical protein
MDSSIIIHSDSETTNLNSPIESAINTSQHDRYKDSPYNQPDFKLPTEDIGIYIFDNGLFTRTLLNIDYNKDREMLIQCTTCFYNKTVSVKRFQSSNFVQHYKNKHATIAYNEKTENKLIKKNNLPSKTDFFNISTDSRKRIRADTIIDFNEENAYIKILNFIVENNLSFNILNSDSFKDLLNYYNKSTPIINRMKIKIILENTYKRYFSVFLQQIQQNIKNDGSFSLTFDIWTSNSQTAFMGIILTFIDIDFKLQYKLIGFNELTESHTGLYIFEEFTKLLNEYNIKNILTITRDNASNNDKFIDLFKAKNKTLYDIRCAAHIINIITQTILKDYILNNQTEKAISEYTDRLNENTNENENNDIVTTKLRKLVVLIKYNLENRKLLIEGIEKYKKEGIIPSNYNTTRIPLDNATRWNSTYKMIKTAIDLKQPLIYIAKVTTNKDYKRYILTETEWTELNELKNIFEIFIKPSVKLQAEIYTTLNLGLLYIYQTYQKLYTLYYNYKEKQRQQINNQTVNYNSLILAINSGLDKFEKYFPKKLTPTTFKHYKPYILSIILDPRFKMMHFNEKGLLHHYSAISNDAIMMLRYEYTKLKIELKSKNITASLSSSFDELGEIYNVSEPESSDSDNDLFIRSEITDEEYNVYLKENIISQKINPLEWWRKNFEKYPILNILARRYLAIPATSASIERIFSISNDIITKKRNRLNAETIKQLVLLKSWKIKDIDELEKLYSEENEGEEEN